MMTSSGFKGGEGTLLLNSAPDGYWRETLCAMKGRPLPPLKLTLFYGVYVVAIIILTVGFPTLVPVPHIDDFVLSSVGVTLSFLLVFRSNASYERWWEARKLWGSTINRTRDLARQSITYMGDDKHVDHMVRYTIAFAVAMKRHLRGERELDEVIDTGVLTPEQTAEIQTAKHMPLYVLNKLSATVQSAKKKNLLGECVKRGQDTAFLASVKPPRAFFYGEMRLWRGCFGC